MLSIADEIQKLEILRESGSLSDQEFEQAKRSLLDSESSRLTESRSLGRAANRFVTFYIIAAILGFIISIGGWLACATSRLIYSNRNSIGLLTLLSRPIATSTTLLAEDLCYPLSRIDNLNVPAACPTN